VTERLDARKTAILKAVVDEYVKLAEPIGSSQIAATGEVQASTATIRHEMASLEQEGYLSQPHVSAGRVPTDRGYRYYVDNISSPNPLGSSQFSQLQGFFDHVKGELEDLLQDTSRLLSSLTNFTSVVTAPPPNTVVVKHVQVVSISSTFAMVIVVGSDGSLEKEVFEVPEGLVDLDLRLVELSNYLSSEMRGKTVGEIDSCVLENHNLEPVLSLTKDALRKISDSATEELFVNDAHKVASAFLAADKVEKILETLEQQILVVSLMKSMLIKGQSVSIGNEIGVPSLSECALVIAPYEIDGRRVGSIGVIGPTRMNYPLALAAVEQVSKGIGRHLVEG
jgi:heat-inducible transcriptional repressor